MQKACWIPSVVVLLVGIKIACHHKILVCEVTGAIGGITQIIGIDLFLKMGYHGKHIG